MSQSEDREEKDAPSKPAEDFRLPARLRDKLGDAAAAGGGDDEWKPEKRSPVGLIVTIVVIVAVIAAGWWLYQNHQAGVRAEAERVAAEAAREKAVADSIAAAVAYADSVAEAARADSIEAFNKLPKWRQRQIVAAQQKAAGGTTAPAAGAAAPGAAGGGDAEEPQESGPFALDAGEFLFEDAAQRAAGTLKESTGLDAAVSAVGSGDNAVYHVYLGRFTSRAAAVKAANDLLANGTVPQARVVPSPK